MGETFQVEKENFLGEESFSVHFRQEFLSLYFVSPSLLI